MKKLLVTMIFLAVAFAPNIHARSAANPSAEEQYQQALKLFDKGFPGNAFSLLKVSANKGYGPAMNAVGYCYQYGKGVSRDYADALQWYKKAAAQGDLEGTYNYGWMHLRGECEKDEALAKKYLTMAANGGHAGAKEILRQEGWLKTEKKQPKYVPEKKESKYIPQKKTYFNSQENQTFNISYLRR